MNEIHDDELLDTRETSLAIREHFGLSISPSLLAVWRHRGGDTLPFFKIPGTGPVRYRWGSVKVWLREHSKPLTCTNQTRIAA